MVSLDLCQILVRVSLGLFNILVVPSDVHCFVFVGPSLFPVGFLLDVISSDDCFGFSLECGVSADLRWIRDGFSLDFHRMLCGFVMDLNFRSIWA